MATKFKLIPGIHSAQKQELTEAVAITEAFEQTGVLLESVTHVLANITTKAEAGENIQAASQDSIAAFLAGVEAVADRLPQSQSQESGKAQSLVRVLNKCAVGQDGYISTDCAPIAEIGAKFPDIRKKYYRELALYNMSLERGPGAANKSLIRAVRVLQHKIDSAMRSVSRLQPKSRPMVGTQPSAGGTPPRTV